MAKQTQEKPAAKQTASKDTETIRVEAHRIGEYGLTLRNPGDKFTLVPKRLNDGTVYTAEEQFEERWMRRLGLGRPAIAQRSEPEPEETDEAEPEVPAFAGRPPHEEI